MKTFFFCLVSVLVDDVAISSGIAGRLPLAVCCVHKYFIFVFMQFAFYRRHRHRVYAPIVGYCLLVGFGEFVSVRMPEHRPHRCVLPHVLNRNCLSKQRRARNR